MQRILFWDAVVSVVIRGQAFLMSLVFEGSRTDCQVKQVLVVNLRKLCKNRQLLQHKFSVVGQICLMMPTDALQAIGNGSKSRPQNSLVRQRRELSK
ncbi:hypothetical protein QUB60_23045 [Microcoleus sp. A2-C5]|uniref:hypothetical protein n=1 Tax=Microcoleaceae TaxID=1892252 RepID=UPI0022385B9E|nr:hypothetical protein [Lyngbya sp. CCAP 1446/10]MCW6048798.1 hypothetical protein [Lyngbya sp. CCAP 1446/10]